MSHPPEQPNKLIPRGKSLEEVKQINAEHGHELLVPPVYRTIVSARFLQEGNQHFQEYVIYALSDGELTPNQIAARPQTLEGVPVEYAMRFIARGAYPVRGE